MAMSAEALEQNYPKSRRDHLSLISQVRSEPQEDYDIVSELPPGILIGEPLPASISDLYFDAIDPTEYGFDRWEFDDGSSAKWIQISSRTLRKPPRNAPDSTRLYSVESITAKGNTTLYEAETVLAYPDGWNTNRREYVPTGVVRISSFGSPVDESIEDAPIMDTASVQLSYDKNIFACASILRSNAGSYSGSEGEILARGESMSFTPPRAKEKKKNRQLSLDGFISPTNQEMEESEIPILPSVRVDGNNAVMRHYGTMYQENGSNVMQLIEIHAPNDVTGLAELIFQQGTYEDDQAADDGIQKGKDESPEDFLPMTEVFRAATQFPVSIDTKIEYVR